MTSTTTTSTTTPLERPPAPSTTTTDAAGEHPTGRAPRPDGTPSRRRWARAAIGGIAVVVAVGLSITVDAGTSPDRYAGDWKDVVVEQQAAMEPPLGHSGDWKDLVVHQRAGTVAAPGYTGDWKDLVFVAGGS